MSWTWVISFVLVILGYVLAILTLLQVVREARTPSGTMAWLLAILLVPWLAVPIYHLLGRRRVRRARSKDLLLDPRARARGGEPWNKLDRLLRAYGINPPTRGNRFRLAWDGVGAYNDLVALISGARFSLDLATFIFNPDKVGLEIRDLLAKKAASGVRVRLLMDYVGTFGLGSDFLEPVSRAGGQVAWFNPIRHIPRTVRVDLRNHRKIVIADGCRAMAGGRNIGAEYLGPEIEPGQWVDLSFFIEGPAVADYSEIFQADWEYAEGEGGPGATGPWRDDFPEDGAGVQVVPSGPDTPGDPLYNSIITGIYTADQRVWIATPYFVPDGPMVTALATAALRGVDVRVMIPTSSDSLLMDLARGHHLRRLQRAGVRILLHERMLHAKMLVADDSLAVVGSANMDVRSFFLNYEAVLFLYGAAEISSVADWYCDTEADCRSERLKVTRLRELGEGFVRLLEPLL